MHAECSELSNLDTRFNLAQRGIGNHAAVFATLALLSFAGRPRVLLAWQRVGWSVILKACPGFSRRLETLGKSETRWFPVLRHPDFEHRAILVAKIQTTGSAIVDMRLRDQIGKAQAKASAVGIEWLVFRHSCQDVFRIAV